MQNRKRARRRLDERFESIRSTGVPQRPYNGWIRTIRDALGMSSTELAARLGLRQQSISDIERNERRDTIRLDTLERVAEAMGCQLVYVLIPRTTLEETVQTQARLRADRLLATVAHHNRLEAQTVSEARRTAQLDDLATLFADRRGLWTETPTAQ